MNQTIDTEKMYKEMHQLETFVSDYCKPCTIRERKLLRNGIVCILNRMLDEADPSIQAARKVKDMEEALALAKEELRKVLFPGRCFTHFNMSE